MNDSRSLDITEIQQKKCKNRDNRKTDEEKFAIIRIYWDKKFSFENEFSSQ